MKWIILLPLTFALTACASTDVVEYREIIAERRLPGDSASIDVTTTTVKCY